MTEQYEVAEVATEEGGEIIRALQDILDCIIPINANELAPHAVYRCSQALT